MSENTLLQVKKCTAVNDKICHIWLKDRIFGIIIIKCKLINWKKRRNIKNDFYDELGHKLDILPNSCTKIIIGDFNVTIGKQNLYRPRIDPDNLHIISNNNGIRLISLCSVKGLTLSRTYSLIAVGLHINEIILNS